MKPSEEETVEHKKAVKNRKYGKKSRIIRNNT